MDSDMRGMGRQNIAEERTAYPAVRTAADVRRKMLAVLAAGAVLGTFWIAGSGRVFAEELTQTTQREETAFDMSTPYPGIAVKAGESVDFDLNFAPGAAGAVDAALTVEEIPEGWEGYFRGESGSRVSRLHVEETVASESSMASFRLTVPEEAEEGEYTVTLKADAGNGVADELELTVSIDGEELGEGSFTSEYPEQQGPSGTSFDFDTTIVNSRGTEQTYSLAAQAPEGWNVAFTPSGESSAVASMMAEGGASKGLTVTVTPPETIKQGEYTILCTAISANEKLSTELKVSITGSYGVSLSTPDGRLSADAYANDESDVTLSITNTGNVDLTNLNLSSSAPANWTVSFDESTIDTLEAGATREITAHIQPNSDAITGDYVTSITVGNDFVTSGADFRVSVKTRTTWGIAAVAVIVILLLILRGIFRKYGRR